MVIRIVFIRNSGNVVKLAPSSILGTGKISRGPGKIRAKNSQNPFTRRRIPPKKPEAAKGAQI